MAAEYTEQAASKCCASSTGNGRSYCDSQMIVKTEEEIGKIRESAHIVHETFEYVRTLIAPGVSTLEINDKADAFIVSKGARPAFKGYKVGL